MVEEFDSSRVICHLDALLTQRELSLTELSKRVGVTLANLSVLKNNRAKAVRYSTLIALCEVLDCQPGDLFTVERRPG
ncbi:helix-turn-helix domain-containing protein [Brevibacterium atlanticum]|uniref:helix-turn-helix domain-containing protein n=1 Tax=Brevibacterium atlanticum TaxID=2697563 RepID=UPI001420312A|nr:helix-turn-helix domain-containing protein [Brevibacterium atlanticum]